MSCTETRSLTFDEISVWDLYDGVVRATGVSRQRHYFVTLAAWDIGNRRKIYLLSELHTSLADKLKGLEGGAQDPETKQERWNSFTQLFENYLRGYEGVLYISCDEPAVGQEISCRLIDTKHLRTLSDYDVEKAVSEAACIYWFGLIA